MNLLEETTISCPYCGEEITLLVDRTIKAQQYVEDCEVCCQPIDIRVRMAADSAIQVDARNENN
jgi:transcription elongation factor Elf1